jgi:glutamate synthase (NADPH) small chain
MSISGRGRPSGAPGTCRGPTYPAIYRSSAAHEEGGTRLLSVNTIEFLGNGQGRLTGRDLLPRPIRPSDVPIG